jgi:uncharacterized membrane protein YphA (DoxX/SURF4 family)
MPPWKTLASHLGAVITAALFLSAGIYKAVDPYKFAALAKNLLVPYDLTLPLALTLGVLETTAGVLVLIPRFRKWGAMLAGALLVAFMGYIGWNYTALQGVDCSCFPELKLPFGITIDMRRKVGPGFFYGDGLMIAGAVLAGWWAKKSHGLRNALVIMGAVAVFTGVSYGVAFSNRPKAPDTITVDGKTVNLQEGKAFLYFFDPRCHTCRAVAKSLAPVKFADGIRVIGVPTTEPEAAPYFAEFTGFKMEMSPDTDKLREIWVFDAPPYGVLLEKGRQALAVTTAQFDENEPEHHLKLLRDAGVIQ